MPLPDDALFAQLEKDVPVALLPVRLEVRFGTRMAGAGAMPVLRVRIYPDDISIRRDRTGLTSTELVAGKQYWRDFAAVADDESKPIAQRGVWERLARQVGAHRARYVASRTENGAAPEPPAVPPPAVAALLPDQWVVTGWVGNRRAFAVSSNPVKPDLVVGLAQDQDLRLRIDPDSPIKLDEETLWLGDYDKAEAVGMAVTIDLLDDERVPLVGDNENITQLLAFGVRSLKPDESAEDQSSELLKLIDLHNGHHGAGFLAQGTPTNNLRGARSGWLSTPDPGSVRPTSLEGAPAFPDRVLRGNGDNGEIAAYALGMKPGQLGGLANASLGEQKLARHMNEALFPVTWGEVIGNLLLPNMIESPTDDDLLPALERASSFVRQHFRDFARARGPLPALLLGRQPYGLLPVTDTKAWKPAAGEAAMLRRLSSLLAQLRPFWQNAAQRSPSLRTKADDLDAASQRLLEILGQGPVPHPRSYGVRTVTGENGTMARSLATPQFSITSDLTTTARTSLYRLMLAALPGIPARARLLKYEMEDPLLLTIPAVDDKGATVPYLESLAIASAASIREGTLWGEGSAPDDLLYNLLVRSLLIANEQSALAIARSMNPDRNFLDAIVAGRGEFFAVDTPTTVSAYTSLLTSASELTALRPDAGAEPLPNQSLLELATQRDQVERFSRYYELYEGPPPTQLFLDTQSAIAALAEAAPAPETAARLMGETLALCSTRLDAWITSIATCRLETLRQRRPQGIRIGAYGWLLDLPRQPQGETQPPANPAGREATGELKTPARQVGWVHAPSIAQAQTASVLRSAEMSHGDLDSTVARIDLTSARIRNATTLLDAIQNGQPLGAVLGYRLERTLQEAGNHEAIHRLRARFPQRSVPIPGADQEQVVPRDVVDGEQAWTAWRKWKGGGLDQDQARQHERLFAGIDRDMKNIDAITESVADLLVADGVHGIVTGNHGRTSASLNAIATGGTLPPEIEVVKTPRSGEAITHKVILPLDATAGASSGWNDEAPRARLIPALENWARGLLGPAGQWVVLVQGADTPGRDWNLSQLDPGICALDVISEISGGAGKQSPLAERIAASAGIQGASIADKNDALSWSKLCALAATAKDVLAACRPLTRADLQRPDHAPGGPSATPAESDIAVLRPKLDAGLGEVAAAVAALEAAFADNPEAEGADAEPLRTALRTLTRYGIPGAAFAGDAALPAAARSAMSAGRATLNAVLATRPDDPDKDKRDPLEIATAEIKALLGPLAIPTISIASPELAADAMPHEVTPADLETWLAQCSRVRPALMNLGDLRAFSEAISEQASPDLRAFQIPNEPSRWLGGKLKQRNRPDGVRTNPLRRFETFGGSNIHFVTVGDAATAPDIEALVIDQWTEVIPSASQTTGVGLHYDAPSARPPQSVLLALHPDPDAGQPWSWTTLEAILADTIDLARLRTVDITQLGPTAIDQYLPAIYARDGIPNVPDLHKVAHKWLLATVTQFADMNLDVRLADD
jgi:hypothetical protein